MVPSVKKKTLHGAQVTVLFCMGLWDKDIGAVKVGILSLGLGLSHP
jgi:hypothetical protein